MRVELREPRWATRLPSSLVFAAATLGPLGRLPAPGTWGSAAGLLYALVGFRDVSASATFIITAGLAWVAVALCGEAERRLGRRDPGCIVLDEFIVFPVVLIGSSGAWAGLVPGWVPPLAGFLLFRLFDILKPFGIARLQRWPGGWGVVADDLAAALAAAAVLHALALAGRLFL